MPDSLVSRAEQLFEELDSLPLHEKIDAINGIRRSLHARSPFAGEPVDFVEWVPGGLVEGNDYNPNSVAPPELKLLEHSIDTDGFTQPIVSHLEVDRRVVVDGFHRQRVGRRSESIKARLHGYLPVVTVRSERGAREDRIAATIRHNRARGIHGVRPMTEIVAALLLAGWSEALVAQRLGMDADEILRFKQVAGLPELFKDRAYSRAWE